MNRLLVLSIVFSLVFFNHIIVSGAQECGVDVYGLTVQDSDIITDIMNTGNETEFIVYNVYVNNNLVFSGNVTLNSSETIQIEANYEFGYGEYIVGVVALADCGSQDYETVSHVVLEDYSCSNPPGLQGQDYCDYSSQQYFICDDGEWVESGGYCYQCNTCGDGVCACGETVENCWQDCSCQRGYLDNYRCYGNYIQREYQNQDCSRDWVNLQYCRYGCENDVCISTPCQPHYYRECYNDDVWWYDSCNGREGVYEYCDSGCFDDYCTDHYCDSGWICTDSHHKAYRYSDCSLGSRIYCRYGCDDGYCDSERECGVDITQFDYVEYVREGYQAYVTTTVLNTGNREEDIEITLYVNGHREGDYEVTLDPDESYIKTLYYYPDSGDNRIRVVVEADCDSSDTRSATAYAQETSYAPPVCNNNGVCEPGLGENENNCWNDCEPEIPVRTSVSFYPESLDMVLYKGKPLVISIRTSEPQVFNIDISGIPSEWASYDEQIGVEREENVYVYIVPREPGTFDLTVSVTALSENLMFDSDIDLYVTPEHRIESSFGGDKINGVIETALSDFWVLLLIIIIIIILVIYAGSRKLRETDSTSWFNMIFKRA